MRSRAPYGLLMLSTALLILISLSTGTKADTIIVDDDSGEWADYTDLEEAVEDAEDGDVIRIYNGTYYRNLYINRSISIIGNASSDTTIRPWTSIDDLIEIEADDVRIENLTIIDSRSTGESAILAVNSENLTIEDCRIQSSYYGIRTSFSDNIVIKDCYFNYNYYGIYTYYSDDIVISGSDIIDSDYRGLYIYGCENALVESNTITDADYGIYSRYGSKHNYIDTTVTDAETGMYFQWTTKVNITFCDVANNVDMGIYMYNSLGFIISYSTITNQSTYGFYINSGGGNHIHHNDIMNNGVNANEIYLDDENQWDDGYEGNHWSDYNGTDDNGDGIGDSELNITNPTSGITSRDRYPIMDQIDPEFRIWIVDSEWAGADFTTIGEAIDSASPGQRILVNSGTYNESLEIDKPLSIIGNGSSRTLLYPNSSWAGVEIVSNDVLLKGIGIDASQTDHGIIVSDSALVRLNDCRIMDGNRVGIWIRNSPDCVVTRSYIINSTQNGINATGGSIDLIVRNTNFRSNNFGILLQPDANGSTIKNCIFRGNAEGVRARDISRTVIEENWFFNNSVYAVRLDYGVERSLVHHNQIDWDDVYDRTGLNWWDDGSEGNYWTNDVHIDSNGDGIVDWPHNATSSSGARDRYPLATPNGTRIGPWTRLVDDNWWKARYTSIQDAIDSASDGDTIRIHAGVYHENVNVNRRVSLIGNGSETIIDGGGYDHSVQIDTSDLSIHSLTTQSNSTIYSGILIGTYYNITISNCTSKNNRYGFELIGSRAINILNSSFIDNDGLGIYLYNTTWINITDCEISGNGRKGILGSTTSRTSIKNSKIFENEETGLWFHRANELEITNCTIRENSHNGIYLENNGHRYPFEIVDSHIHNNSWDGMYINTASMGRIARCKLAFNLGQGIELQTCNNLTFERSLILNQSFEGIFMSSSSDIVIRFNSIVGNGDHGVYSRYQGGHRIHHNDFIDNNPGSTQAFEYNSIWNVSWDDGEEGNYWSDYDGVDKDGDGVGDTPYTISNVTVNAVDRYPLTNLVGVHLGNVIIVDDDWAGADHKRIQDAIDSSKPGTVIRVFSGSYNENLQVDHEVWIMGNGTASTFIWGSPNRPVLNITSNQSRIMKASFNCNGTDRGSSAVLITGSNGTRIADCSFSGENGTGISVISSTNLKVVGSIIRGFSTTGINFTNSTGCIVQDSIVKNNGDGISLYRDCSWNSIIGSQISSNLRYGVHMKDGPHLNFATFNEIHDNKFHGVFLLNKCRRNYIHHNNFVDNGGVHQGYDATGTSRWDDGAEGNFWSDYPSGDFNDDGIGEQPYVIDGVGSSADRYPLDNANGSRRGPWTWIVDPQWLDAQFQTISDASDRAKDGDTIRVYNGEYRESIEINNSISIIGNGTRKTLVTPGTPYHVFQVNAPDVWIERLSIDGENTGAIGIRGQYSHRLIVSRCMISRTKNAVYVYVSNGVQIEDTFIDNCTSNSIDVNYADRTKVLRTKIIESGYNGIDLYRTENTTIGNSDVLRSFRHGIQIYDSEDSWIRNSRINRSGMNGIYIYSVEDVDVKYCKIYDTRNWGIRLYDADWVDIVRNDIVDSGDGGIYMGDGCRDNEAYLNNLVNNGTEHQAADLWNNTWDSDFYGNYYIDYNGKDKDENGIGDRPYKIWNGTYGGAPGNTNWTVVDRYPMMGWIDNTMNIRPVAIIESVDPVLADNGTNITFVGSGYDPDSSIRRYAWSSSIDGEFLNTSNKWSIYNELSLGHHTISLRVRDKGFAWSAPVVVNITIGIGRRPINKRPFVTISDITPNPVVFGTEVIFSLLVSDDKKVASYNITSSINGTFVNETFNISTPDFDSKTVTFSYDGLYIGNHTICARVMDINGTWSHKATAVLRVKRPDYEAKIVSIIPNPARYAQNTTFQGKGVWGGRIVRYVWNSSVDGRLYNGPERTFNLINLTNGRHTISLRVKNETGNWTEEVYISLFVNTPPNITADLDRLTGVVSGTVEITGTSTDPEQKLSRVEYKIDGGLWMSADGLFVWNINLDTTELENGDHSISIRSYDGLAYSDEVHWNFTVSNHDRSDPSVSWFFPMLALAIGIAVAVAFIVLRRKLDRERPGSANDAENGLNVYDASDFEGLDWDEDGPD